MPALSSAAWVVHDVGLATSIGGALFGKAALHPALHKIDDADLRDEVAGAAWTRYGYWNLAAHAVVAATWFTGRSMLTGGEAGRDARALTLVKDVAIATALVSAVASAVIGRWLGKKTAEGQGPERARDGEIRDRAVLRGDTAVNVMTNVNLVANTIALGTTALLAMEAGESPRFAVTSRRLP